MTPKEKLFTPDYSKRKYTIKIDVYENCSILGIGEAGTYVTSYHEVIGVLETQKNGLMFAQREKNMKAAKKKTK